MKEIRRKTRPMMDLKDDIIPSLTALEAAGVVFKHTPTVPFWHIDFKGESQRYLKLRSTCSQFTESILVNLMAFELSRVNMRRIVSMSQHAYFSWITW